MNTPTGAHAHGYADANFLIPELVSGVQFKKGPYFADEGDFSAAGAANINYVNRARRGRSSASVAGGDGWGRALAQASPRVGGRPPAGRARGQPQRRPVGAARRLSEGQRRVALQPRRRAQRLLASPAWATGPIGTRPTRCPQRADRQRGDLAIRVHRPDGSGHDRTTEPRRGVAALSGQRHHCARPAFVLRNRLNLFSNFTYFLDDPDQRRSIRAGGAACRRRRARIASPPRAAVRSSHRERRRRSGAPRLARPGRPVPHRGREAAHDDARRPRRPDDGRRVCADRDGVDAHAAHDGRSARRRVPVLASRRTTRSTPATAPTRW